MFQKKRLLEITKQVSEELGLPLKDVKKAVEQYYRAHYRELADGRDTGLVNIGTFRKPKSKK